MRPTPRLAATVAALALPCLVLVSPAFASDTYCVAKPSCVGLSEPTLGAALAASNADADLDFIQIGPVTLPERDLSASNPVQIVGSGPSTVIAGPKNTTNGPNFVLGLDGTQSTVSDLTVRLDQTGAVLTGNVLTLHGNTAARVAVEGIGAHMGVGVTLTTGGVFRDGTVTLPVDGNGRGTGVSMFGGTVDNSNVSAFSGISALGVVRHSRVFGLVSGIEGTALGAGGSLTVEDTVIRTGPSAVSSNVETGLSITSEGIEPANGTMSLTARHVTLRGSGAGSAIGLRSNAIAAGHAGASASVDARDVIIRGYGTALSRTASQNSDGLGTASLAIDWSDYDPSPGARSQSGPGSITDGPNSVNLDPQFRDAPNGDLRLRGTSPLIDRGDTAPLGGQESTTDVAGRPRVVDGDADGSARRDIGAYEYQGRPAITSVGASPNPASAGQTVTFTASATPSAESAIADYKWDLDGDGTFETDTGPTPTATHLYPAPGAVPVKVQVTALDGGFAKGSLTLSVTNPPNTTRPSISSFTVTNRVFAVGSKATAVAATRTHPRGTVLLYALSEPAAVTVTIAREASGRKVNGNCVKPSRGNAKRGRCTRYLKVGALRRAGARGANRLPFSGRIGNAALAPATYRATIVAVAGGGLKSKSRAVSFRIVSR